MLPISYLSESIRELRPPPPRTKYKTPSEPQNAPQNAPRILSRNQSTKKKKRKIFENRGFLYIFRIFSAFWFRETIWGVFWGNRGFLYIFRIFSAFWFREMIRGVFWGVFWSSEGFCFLCGAEEMAIRENLPIPIPISNYLEFIIAIPPLPPGHFTSYATTSNPKAGAGVECRTPTRSTSPNSCSTGPVCGNSSEKSHVLQEKGPGVQGKRWPKYRCSVLLIFSP